MKNFYCVQLQSSLSLSLLSFAQFQVSDMFKLDWGTYLTTTESVIYAVIDGRGSGFRGDDLLHEIYYNLGGVEVQDQLDVTRQLLKRYSFLDKTKVAIWGWSYGGDYFFC